MAFDMSKFMDGMSRLLDDATRAIRKIAPTALSPEKQFVNSTSGALSLLIVADGKIEADETLAAVSFIQNLDPVKELGLAREALAFYEKYVEQMVPHFDNPVKLTLEQAKILADIAIIKGNQGYVRQLVAICEGVVGTAANEKERDMLRKIKEAVGA